ncbi:MAG: NAD-dependent epimerase/dehydratase family protein, partial [Bradymonadaceae bacterium]
EHGGGFRSNYEQTKYEAHRLVEELIDQGAPVVNMIVSTVYGPGDESPVAELIEHHLAGRALAHLDRRAGYTFTHVDDVAAALRLGYERGEIGQRYLVSGTPATFEGFFDQLSELTGIAAPKFEVPSRLVDMIKPVLEAIAPLIGKSAAEVDESLAMGRNVTRFFSGDKAREELGWEPRTLDEGLRQT